MNRFTMMTEDKTAVVRTHERETMCNVSTQRLFMHEATEMMDSENITPTVLAIPSTRSSGDEQATPIVADAENIGYLPGERVLARPYPLHDNRPRVRELTSGIEMFIDTGAVCSILKPHGPEHNWQINESINSADNSPIQTYGLKKVEVDIGLQRSFSHTFLIANVVEPIIGADFLQKYELTLDFHRNVLKDQKTGIAVEWLPSRDNDGNIIPPKRKSFLEQSLDLRYERKNFLQRNLKRLRSTCRRWKNFATRANCSIS